MIEAMGIRFIRLIRCVGAPIQAYYLESTCYTWKLNYRFVGLLTDSRREPPIKQLTNRRYVAKRRDYLGNNVTASDYQS